jgi:hypothetical protein
MKEERIVWLGARNKPLHCIYHILSRWMPFLIANIIRKYHDIFRLVMVLA